MVTLTAVIVGIVSLSVHGYCGNTGYSANVGNSQHRIQYEQGQSRLHCAWFIWFQ